LIREENDAAAALEEGSETSAEFPRVNVQNAMGRALMIGLFGIAGLCLLVPLGLKSHMASANLEDAEKDFSFGKMLDSVMSPDPDKLIDKIFAEIKTERTKKIKGLDNLPRLILHQYADKVIMNELNMLITDCDGYSCTDCFMKDVRKAVIKAKEANDDFFTSASTWFDSSNAAQNYCLLLAPQSKSFTVEDLKRGSPKAFAGCFNTGLSHEMSKRNYMGMRVAHQSMEPMKELSFGHCGIGERPSFGTSGEHHPDLTVWGESAYQPSNSVMDNFGKMGSQMGSSITAGTSSLFDHLPDISSKGGWN